jgi:hypothetical protein
MNNSSHPLRAVELTSQHHRLRLTKLAWHSAVAEVCFGVAHRAATARLFERAIERALHQAPDTAPAFTLPAAIALKALGNSALAEVPTSALNKRLHDWVRYEGKAAFSGDYFICSADWSAWLTDLSSSSVMTEANQMHQAGLDYKSTRIYAKHLQNIERGAAVIRNKVSLDTPLKLNAYFNRFVALFESIQKHGVLPLKQARNCDEALSTSSSVRSWRTNFGEKDIGVAIGPDAELVLLPGAKHRLAIARVLGIARVPVQMRMVHKAWLQRIAKPVELNWTEALTQAVQEATASYGIAPAKATP